MDTHMDVDETSHNGSPSGPTASPDAGTGSVSDATSSAGPNLTAGTPSLVAEKEQKLRDLEKVKSAMIEQRRAFVVSHRKGELYKAEVSTPDFCNQYFVPADWFRKMEAFLDGTSDVDPGVITNHQFFDSMGSLRNSIMSQEYTSLSGQEWWVLRRVFGHNCAISRYAGQGFYSWPASQETCSQYLSKLDAAVRSFGILAWNKLRVALEVAKKDLADTLLAKINEDERPIVAMRTRLKEIGAAGSGSDGASVVGDADMSCAVCLATRRTIVFKGCRHCCTCKDCADQLYNCPVCNARITGRERVYL